jgi:hypothetical protein
MAGRHRGAPSQGEVTLELQERRVNLSEQREERFQRAQSQRERRQSGAPGFSPARAAGRITQRPDYSGKGMLTGLLLIGFVIILVRVVADFEVSGDGSAKGSVLHPAGEYGPLTIAVAMIASFFFLSFLAIGGGTRAKLAVILGGCIVLTLGVKSYPELVKVGSVIGTIGTVTVPPPSGTEESGAVVTPLGNSGGTSGSSGSSGSGVTGWTTVPNTNEVYAQNGQCPSGYTLSGDRCVPALASGIPAT